MPQFTLIKRLTATAAEIGVERHPVPAPGDILAADPSVVDLAAAEFEATGFGTGRKVLQPGEVTEKHSTGKVRELIFCLEGEVVVRLGSAEPFTLKAGEMSYIPPATLHELKNEGTDRCIYLFVYSKADETLAKEEKHSH